MADEVSLFHWHALVQVAHDAGVAGVAGGAGVVGNQHNRFAEITVQTPEDFQHLRG